MHKQNRNTWLFIAFLLFAGIVNLCSRTAIPALNTLLTCVNYVTFVGLLLFWNEAVRVRLLPSGAKTYIVSAGLLLLLYMLVRIFKYRFAVEPVVMRYALYAYWISQILVPTLFLMTCIRIRRGRAVQGKQREAWLLIPASFLVLTILTNELHFLVYTPLIGLSNCTLDTGTYTHGPVFYLSCGWMILTVGTGLILLFRKTGRFSKRAVWHLLTVVLLWFGYALAAYLMIDRIPNSVHMFNVPEIHVFGMLGVFEICIRHRLIPYNENYSDFFRVLHIPALITDRHLGTAYSSEIPLPADPKAMQTALQAPVALTPDLKLSAKTIRAGYAFWTEDETAIHRAQARLMEANEMIEQKNDLIRAETEQKKKDVYLQSRHRIYHEIAAELYPVQKQIGQLLDQAVPGTNGFKEKIANISVLNAYVKRKTNLLLLAAEKNSMSLKELFLALQESANYLTLAGLQTTANLSEDAVLPADRILAFYDVFELLAEQLLGKAPSLMVSWNAGGLRLAAKTDQLPDIDNMPLPVNFFKSEDILYMEIGKEGDAV